MLRISYKIKYLISRFLMAKPKPRHKNILTWSVLLGIAILVVTIAVVAILNSKPPIKVGVLHSLSGTLAISEKPVVESTLLAIEEINRSGGILGRRIEPIVVDGKSDWQEFARQAERLITQDKVATIFGCWTSASRKTVKPVLEEYNHLLIYPVQYEGLEQSPNIIYTGAAPNQQIIPGVKWAFENLGKKFFLVGSDYVFPRSANEIIKAQVKALKGQIVGEEYLLLGSQDVEEVISKIKKSQPDAILNTINGDSNIAFFKALRQAGIAPDKIPTISFSIAESELQEMGAEVVGDYAVWNYFQSVRTPANQAFIAAFQARYGKERVVNDPMEAAYFGVKLWAQAVAKAKSDQTSAIRTALIRQSYNAPQGVVYIDPQNQHTWKTVRVGKITADRQFDIVWSSGRPVQPIPYPVYKSKEEWQSFLGAMYQGWGGNWANLGRKEK